MDENGDVGEVVEAFADTAGQKLEHRPGEQLSIWNSSGSAWGAVGSSCQRQRNKSSLPYVIPAAWQKFSGRDLHLVHVSCQVVSHTPGKVVGHTLGAEAACHPLGQGAKGS